MMATCAAGAGTTRKPSGLLDDWTPHSAGHRKKTLSHLDGLTGKASLIPHTARVCAVHSVPAVLQPFADLGEDRLFVGELAGLELGIHQLVIDRQLKTPAAGRLQLQALKALFVLAENLGRQTDGLRLVVSSRTITQMHFHVCRSPIYRG